MFTGIIQTIGTIKKITANQITIEAGDLVKELKEGASIAVNGICLTATEVQEEQFSADFMPETAQKTTLGQCKIDDEVNLELAMKMGERFEGHMVSGHVEGVGEITDIEDNDNAYEFLIQIPEELGKYIIDKGSIAINGVSLTVIAIEENQVRIGIIPHTFKHTTFQYLKKGDRVNIETDILAKYFEKSTQWQK